MHAPVIYKVTLHTRKNENIPLSLLIIAIQQTLDLTEAMLRNLAVGAGSQPDGSMSRIPSLGGVGVGDDALPHNAKMSIQYVCTV